MNLLKTAYFLPLALCCACGSTSRGPANVADRVAGQASPAKTPFELTIKPATVAVAGGQRLPLQFTIRNTGNQPVRTCLSHGRVVHLWGIDKQYAYTVAEHSGDQPSCDETLDLAPQAAHSWTEDITIPSIAASSAKIVGFAQIAEPEGCAQNDCRPIWLTASYAPFTIEAAAVAPGPTLDLRTGAKVAAVVGNPR